MAVPNPGIAVIPEHPNVLITDDDRAFRETLRGMLEPRGFCTLVAEDGEEALKIVEREPIHLLLLDHHMPRLTGLQTVRRIRMAHSRLPCVLMSAALDESILTQARLIDIFSVLPKPISSTDLNATVDRVFQHIYGWPAPSSLTPHSGENRFV